MQYIKGILKRSTYLLSILAMLSVVSIATAQAETTIVGRWKTIDDITGKPKALVQIQKGSNGEYFGVVEDTFGAAPLKICEKCSGERKNQPIIGMTIMSGMKSQSDGSFGGGEIIDPKTGRVYSCKATLEDGGKHLVVRGYLGVSLLGRSQTWVRES